MNYLAHIFLSGEEKPVQLGGFIADSVKGSRYNQFPEGIRFGILMHRKIDTFTDSHPAALQTAHRLRSVYGKFAGVTADILYDHFLASDWGNYCKTPLGTYAQNFYKVLNNNKVWLPQQLLQFLPVFIRKDRLNSYTNLNTFQEILKKMGEHTGMPQKSEQAVQLIHKQYYEFKNDFLQFFPELQAYAKELMTFRNSEPKQFLAYKTKEN